MNFWFVDGDTVAAGSDGKSSAIVEFSAEVISYTTSDAGATCTLSGTDIGHRITTVGEIYHLDDGAGNACQYKVTRIVDYNEIEMEHYNGTAIALSVTITNTTGPFDTLGDAIDTFANGDWIWVKATTYTDQHGATGSIGQFSPAHISTVASTFCNYKTIPGDGFAHPDIMGVDSDYAVNINAAGLTSGISYSGYNSVLNIRFIGFSCYGATAQGWNSESMGGCQYINCDAHSNGSYGAYLGYNSTLINFVAANNTTIGLSPGANSYLNGIKVYGNGGIGINTTSFFGHIINALVYGNAGGVRLYGGWTLDSSTIDANGGPDITSASSYTVLVKNSIIFNALDLISAVHPDNTVIFQNSIIGKYSHLHNSGNVPLMLDSTDLGAGATFADFGFVNGAGNDYRLTKRSLALEAGSPAYQSIGYHEPERQKFKNVGKVTN